MSIFIVVDLPAPFGPRKPTSAPAATSKLTPRTAWTGPKDLLSPTASIIDAWLMPPGRP